MAGTMGVELESFGLTAQELTEAINGTRSDEVLQLPEEGRIYGYLESKRVPLRNKENGTENVWIAAEDGSIKDRNGYRHPLGHEVISPVLEGEAGWASMKRVMRALSKAGAKVNKSCGTHITFGLRNCSARVRRMSNKKMNIVLGRLCDLYSYFQPLGIDTLVAPSRRVTADNIYCRPVSGTQYFGVGDAYEYTRKILNGVGRGVINLQNFASAGVVEFRQMNGTLNGDKLETWGLLMKKILAYCINSTNLTGNEDFRNYSPTIHGLLDLIDAGVELRRRVLARKDEVDAVLTPSNIGHMVLDARTAFCNNQWDEMNAVEVIA